MISSAVSWKPPSARAAAAIPFSKLSFECLRNSSTALRLFFQADVLNVFNEGAQIGGVTTVDSFDNFNPYTETPVEGVNWELDEDFGDATSEDDFQTPRFYRFSVGIRF